MRSHIHVNVHSLKIRTNYTLFVFHIVWFCDNKVSLSSPHMNDSRSEQRRNFIKGHSSDDNNDECEYYYNILHACPYFMSICRI